MGANVLSRPRTQRDVLRIFAQVKGSPFDPARRWQTPGTALEFPGTEEVTGSNPVRPTTFFENPSSAGSPNGSQPPAVSPSNRRLTRAFTVRVCAREPPGDSGLIPARSGAHHRLRRTARRFLSPGHRGPAGSFRVIPRPEGARLHGPAAAAIQAPSLSRTANTPVHPGIA